MLAGYGFLIGQAEIYKARDLARLHSMLANAAPGVPLVRADAAIRLNAAPKKGSVLGELEIPRLGIDAIVLEGDTSGILRRAAGHIPGTAFPDNFGGNVGVAAHRDTYFRPLRFIHAGDLIILKTPAGSYHYYVQSTHIVEPDDVAVLGNTKQSTLTLVTCYPFYFVGPAPHRFVVRAAEAPPE
jgi:sortase A